MTVSRPHSKPMTYSDSHTARYISRPLLFEGLLLCLYSCCFHLEHKASVKRFVPLKFLNRRQSVGLLGRMISPSQGRYLTQTQNQRRQNIHAFSGIRTQDPSVQASEDIPCFRPRGHCLRCCLMCYDM
jgi:hypothetical protein